MLYLQVCRPFAIRLNWALVHPVSVDHPWDVSTTWLESTCRKFHLLDMIWKGTRLSIQGPTVDSTCQSKSLAIRLKELFVELWGRIVSRHRSGEGYQNISGWSLEPRLFLDLAAWPNLAIGGERSWSGRWPRTRWSLWQSSRVPLCRWENLPEGQPFLQHSTDKAFMVEWPDGSYSSVKGTWQPSWSLPKGT